MGRVSLTEDYDDRSVIAKLNEMDKRVTENTTVVTSAEASAKASAQAAQETADRFAGSVGAVVQNANAQINASKAQVDQAKAEVDETVTTVAQAVQTANQASASAQQSATTVATYDTRLTAVESETTGLDSDLGAVTLRVTTAEGQIVTIEGRVTALETADGQNVKINSINDYAVGLTGNQDVNGLKNMLVPIHGGYMLFNQNLGTFADGEYVRIYRGLSFAQTRLMIYGTQANNGLGVVDIMVGGSNNYDRSYMITLRGVFEQGVKFLAIQMADHTELWMKKTPTIGYVQVIVTHSLRDFDKTNVVAGTGMTEAPVIGDTNPITSEPITGVKEVTLS